MIHNKDNLSKLELDILEYIENAPVNVIITTNVIKKHFGQYVGNELKHLNAKRFIYRKDYGWELDR